MIWRMAWRNAWRNPRRTAVVVTAVAVGIAGVVLTMAVNYGMVVQMMETAISTELGHLQIHAAGFDQNPELAVRLEDGGSAAAEALAALGGVAAWARRVRAEGLITSPRSSAGVRVVGIEPEREAEVSIVARSIRQGRYLGGVNGVKRRVLIGEKLARRLEVDVGDKVVLSVQDLAGDLGAEALRVAGIFKTPMGELDGGTVFVRIDEGQALFGLGRAVSEIVVVAHDRAHVPALREMLAARLPGAEVRSWKELRPVLVYLVKLFDQMALWVYVAAFVAMAFGIANVLLMAVYERIREIGIMMAVGMKGRRLVLMIVVESLFVTLLGLALGFAGAVAGVWALQDGIDLSFFAEGLSAFGVGTRLVPVLRWADFTVPMAVALVTALVASAWPALHAVRFRPAEAVRRV
jgi:ABC-type lipoprotein release transport system permease subunit